MAEGSGNAVRIDVLKLLLWPAESFSDTREFITRVPSAGLAVIIIGSLLTGLGVSAGVASAVSVLGAAALFTDTVLKVVLRAKDPLKHLNFTDKAVAFLVYFLTGLVFYIFQGQGSLNALSPTLIQYVVGIVIVYLVTVVYMGVWDQFKGKGFNISVVIVVSMAITIGFFVMFFYVFKEVIVITSSKGLFSLPSFSTNIFHVSTSSIGHGLTNNTSKIVNKVK